MDGILSDIKAIDGEFVSDGISSSPFLRGEIMSAAK